MKYLIYIIAISSICLTQEMEVQGDLKVTGSVQSTTIDSLLQVIQSLESQLSFLQIENSLETRVFETGEVYQGTIIDFDEILGYDFNYFILEIINATPINFTPTESMDFQIENSLSDHFGKVRGVYSNLNTFTWDLTTNTRGLFLDNGEDIIFSGSGHWNFTIVVTAQFPSEPSTQQSQTTSKQSK